MINTTLPLGNNRSRLDDLIQMLMLPGVLPVPPAAGAIGPLRAALRAGPVYREAGAMAAPAEDALRSALMRYMPQASGLGEAMTQRIGGTAVKGMRAGGELEAQILRLLAEGSMTGRNRLNALKLMASKLIN